ncbi:MAG: putative Ig domain-containing protein [Steroidobacteraceae bacterium]
MQFLRHFGALLMVLTIVTAPTSSEARSWRWRNNSTTSNSAPVISGSPITTATIGTAYKFQPSASDANGDTLTFSIVGKPGWASFSTSSGLISGTPTAAGTYSNISISVSDGKSSASLAAFSITVTGTTNASPTISGSSLTSITAGSTYSFTPTAKDADGDALGFSISNKPSWANFSTLTGTLSGTPTTSNAGTYSNIIISVSDGLSSASLSPFSLTVATATATTGSATISWMPPTTNTDGSTLTNLAGYKIYYGTSSSNLTSTVAVSSGLSAYVISNLPAGTWYFAIASINSSGAESSLSGIASKTI